MAFITRTGTVKYNKAKFNPMDRQRLRIAKCSHNATATAIPAANVVNMIPIPADSIILGVALDVEDNQADTDLKIGLTADDDLFSAATALDANATTVAPTTIGTIQGMPYYTNAATNVIVTAVTNEINAATFTVRAVYVEVDAQASAN